MRFARTTFRQLRLRYRFLLGTLLSLCLAVTIFLHLWFTIWLAYRLRVPMLCAPLRDPSGGLPGLAHRLGVPILYGPNPPFLRELLWMVPMVAGFVIFWVACYLVVFGLLAVGFRCWAGWSSVEAYRFVTQSEMPTSWHKSPAGA